MEKFFYISANNQYDTSVFRVALAGITYPDPAYKVYRESSQVYVAEYISDGAGTVLYDGNEYQIKKGDAYILSAGEEHKYYSDNNNPWTKKWFNISGELCESLLSVYGIEKKVVFHNTSIGEIFDEFFDFCTKNTEVDKIDEFGAVIFHRIVQRLSANTEKSKRSFAAEIKSYIDSNIYEGLTAASVARNAGFSVSQLGRIFKSEYGETVYSYILEQKIRTAENLLKNTGLTVKEISALLKFTDEHYFCNIFKKKRGVTPSRYRR